MSRLAVSASGPEPSLVAPSSFAGRKNAAVSTRRACRAGISQFISGAVQCSDGAGRCFRLRLKGDARYCRFLHHRPHCLLYQPVSPVLQCSYVPRLLFLWPVACIMALRSLALVRIVLVRFVLHSTTGKCLHSCSSLAVHSFELLCQCSHVAWWARTCCSAQFIRWIIVFSYPLCKDFYIFATIHTNELRQAAVQLLKIVFRYFLYSIYSVN